MNTAIFVTPDELKAMRRWPVELQALFNPAADRKLAEQIAAERAASRAGNGAVGGNAQHQSGETSPF